MIVKSLHLGAGFFMALFLVDGFWFLLPRKVPDTPMFLPN